MKKCIIILIVLSCLLGACSNADQSDDSIQIDMSKSWFRDFFVENEKVVIKCRIFIDNPTDNEVRVILIGSFQKDYEAGLLKEMRIVAVLEEKPEDIIIIVPPGGAVFNIDFCGTYGGLFQKQDRLLPEIEVITL